jgi:hypothetical protein
MILNPSMKDHIIIIIDSPPENPVASKKHKKVVKEDNIQEPNLVTYNKHKKVVKEDKIQEPKPIREDPEEFQELDSEIIIKRMKLKDRIPVQVPIYIGVHPGSVSYVFSQDPPVLEQAETNIAGTVKHKGKQILDFPYLDTESSESKTTPTYSSQQSIPITKLDILPKESLKDLDM